MSIKIFKKNNLVESKSLAMNNCVFFHDLLVGLGIFLCGFILISLIFLFLKTKICSLYTEKISLEIFWTVVPGIILIFIAIPSLTNLYRAEKSKIKILNSLKVEGHQWYWKYKGDLGKNHRIFSVNRKNSKKIIFQNYFEKFSFDSYIKKDSIKFKGYRLLEVRKPVFLKPKIYNRFLVSSDDVIHSFRVESLGIKIDAVPGRVKIGYTLKFLTGSFFGQCSEICGENHRFMPIKIEIWKNV